MNILRRCFASTTTSSLFASDNVSGCDARIFARIAQEYGHSTTTTTTSSSFVDPSATRSSYGGDATTRRVVSRLARTVARDDADAVDVQLVYNGTAANVAAMACVLRPFDAVLAAQHAHLLTAECGALERFAGARIVPMASRDAFTGLVDEHDVQRAVDLCGERDDVHAVRPRVLSITQVNEFGVAYSLGDVAALRRACDRHRLLLHIDGARIANAAAHLGASFADVLQHADLASFGMTKNGALCGEALLLFRSRLLRRGVALDDIEQAGRVRKQAMQLHSKSAFLAAQFDAFLDDDVWRANAAHANGMAQLLARLITQRADAIRITRRVDANAVFVRFPTPQVLAAVQQTYSSLGEWAPPNPEVRLMCSYATTAAQVEALVACFTRALALK
jgi:threonine aldolase